MYSCQVALGLRLRTGSSLKHSSSAAMLSSQLNCRRIELLLKTPTLIRMEACGVSALFSRSNLFSRQARTCNLNSK